MKIKTSQQTKKKKIYINVKRPVKQMMYWLLNRRDTKQVKLAAPGANDTGTLASMVLLNRKRRATTRSMMWIH